MTAPDLRPGPAERIAVALTLLAICLIVWVVVLSIADWVRS